jgi:hypothetical protein
MTHRLAATPRFNISLIGRGKKALSIKRDGYVNKY